MLSSNPVKALFPLNYLPNCISFLILSNFLFLFLCTCSFPLCSTFLSRFLFFLSRFSSHLAILLYSFFLLSNSPSSDVMFALRNCFSSLPGYSFCRRPHATCSMRCLSKCFSQFSCTTYLDDSNWIHLLEAINMFVTETIDTILEAKTRSILALLDALIVRNCVLHVLRCPIKLPRLESFLGSTSRSKIIQRMQGIMLSTY